FAITKNFMPKDIKTLGNNKARACESLGFVHKKRLCQRFDTTSLFFERFERLFFFKDLVIYK
ncbi:hypothetical protein, partial [Bacteroides faecis]